MKNNFLLFMCFVGLLGIFFGTNLSYKLISNLTSKTIITNRSAKFACSTIGSESTLTVKATAKEKTSGIAEWYCHNYNTGTWVACPSSLNCSIYSLTGWNGYDKIRTYDIAGNVSNDYTLYKSAYENPKGQRDNDSSFSVSVGTNPIHILSYSENAGTISSVSIVNNSIKLTGKPAVKTEQKKTETSSPATSEKLCSVGKPIESNGTYSCNATSYRLQNDTCVCVFKKNYSGKYEFDYEFDTDSDWAKDTICQRTATYCSDDYDKVSSTDDKYNVITRREPNNQNVTSGVEASNSNLYSRSKDSLCYTYYKTDGNGKEYYSTFPKDWYESFYVFSTRIKDYHENTSTYPALPANDGMKELMVKASSSTNPCTNKSGVTTGSNYYSSPLSATKDGTKGLCNFLRDELNADNEDIKGITTESDGLMVSVISSATCQFNGGTVNTVDYSEKMIDLDNNLLYYCTSGEIRNTGSGYECVNTTYYNEEYYYYDWYVNYFRK